MTKAILVVVEIESVFEPPSAFSDSDWIGAGSVHCHFRRLQLCELLNEISDCVSWSCAGVSIGVMVSRLILRLRDGGGEGYSARSSSLLF